MTRLLTMLCTMLALAACNRSLEDCAKIKPGMTVSKVIEIMGEPTDSYLTGHPPNGLMLLYGHGRLSKWPQEPGGPIGVALDDAPSQAAADRIVSGAYCNAL